MYTHWIANFSLTGISSNGDTGTSKIEKDHGTENYSEVLDSNSDAADEILVVNSTK
jgi:hypothetical protein